MSCQVGLVVRGTECTGYREGPFIVPRLATMTSFCLPPWPETFLFAVVSQFISECSRRILPPITGLFISNFHNLICTAALADLPGGADKASAVSKSTPIVVTCDGALITITYDDHLDRIPLPSMGKQGPLHSRQQRERQCRSRARSPMHFIFQTVPGRT